LIKASSLKSHWTGLGVVVWFIIWYFNYKYYALLVDLLHLIYQVTFGHFTNKILRRYFVAKTNKKLAFSEWKKGLGLSENINLI
jgi:hypothetical protein